MPKSRHVEAVETMRAAIDPMDPRGQVVMVMVCHREAELTNLAREVIVPALRTAGLRVQCYEGGMGGRPLEANDRDAHVIIHIVNDGTTAQEALLGEAWA